MTILMRECWILCVFDRFWFLFEASSWAREPIIVKQYCVRTQHRFKNSPWFGFERTATLISKTSAENFHPDFTTPTPYITEIRFNRNKNLFEHTFYCAVMRESTADVLVFCVVWTRGASVNNRSIGRKRTNSKNCDSSTLLYNCWSETIKDFCQQWHLSRSINKLDAFACELNRTSKCHGGKV